MKKLIVIVVCVAMCISLSGCLPLFVIGTLTDQEASTNQSQSITTTTTTAATTSKEDSYFKTDNTEKGDVVEVDTTLVTTLTEAGYSLEHATKIAEILNAVGIESIEIENMTGTPEKGLNAVVCYPNGYTTRDRRFFFTTEDGVLFIASFTSETLYDVEQGGYLKSYGDVHVPEKSIDMNTYTTLQAMAETEVKKYLNYPNTADFGLLNWGVGRSDENYKIIGIVTAQNAFGVEDEISFSVWFKQTDNGFTVEGVALDGQRVK